MDLKKIKTQSIRDLVKLLESTVEGYALIDESFNLTIFNRRMEEFLYNFSGVKMRKQHSILECIPQLFRNDFSSSVKSSFNGKIVIDEKHIVFKDNFWFRISYTPYFRNEQKVEAVLISVLDILKEWKITKLTADTAEFLDSVFDTTAGIASVNMDGTITRVNDSFCGILGYKKEELIKVNYFDLVTDEDKKISRDRLTGFLSADKFFFLEVKLIHKMGKTVIALQETSYFINESNEPFIIISIVDITEKKYAEQELKAREMFYKALIERSADMKILTSADGHIIFGSSSITKFLGYSFEDLEGRHVAEFVPTEDIPQLAMLMDGVMQQPGTSVQLQQRIMDKDGEWRYCEGTVTNLLNDPNVRALVSNFRDITEKRTAIESLKTSEANLRAIFNNVDLGFVLLDKEMRILLFNPVASEWSVRTFNKCLEKGNSFLDYISQNASLIFAANFNKVLENTVFSSEVNYKTESGLTLWYHVRISPVLNEQEEVIGACIAASDITARKRVEIEKEKITQDLIKRNKDLQQFAYIVSHNLRGPTANIMALADMLKNFKDLSKSDRTTILNGLSTSSHQLDMVIRDLNHILQIGNTVGEKREWVDFSELLQELRLTIEHLIVKESAKIITDFESAPNIKTIRLYLYSIFYNLITNSLKYRDPLIPLAIKIKSEKTADGVILYFSDNGIGIDLSRHGEKIFGLYNRFHLHKEGKGMGLFMVKSQVEAIGGKINVQSEQGKGTEFKIEFKNEDPSFHNHR